MKRESKSKGEMVAALSDSLMKAARAHFGYWRWSRSKFSSEESMCTLFALLQTFAHGAKSGGIPPDMAVESAIRLIGKTYGIEVQHQTIDADDVENFGFVPTHASSKARH